MSLKVYRMKFYSDSRTSQLFIVTLILLMSVSMCYGQNSYFKSELILPFQSEHVHGSTIVELPNGDLLAGWYQGSGERWADNVKIYGARKKFGSNEWSKPFVLADIKGFPDINPILFMDGKHHLWLMWYTVIANQWETSLLNYRISDDYSNMLGPPLWDWQSNLLVKPGDKTERGIQPEDSFVRSVKKQLKELKKNFKSAKEEKLYNNWSHQIISKAKGKNMVKDGRIIHKDGTYEKAKLGYPYFRRMGWQTRNKPFITRSGRMIVPLYSDGFSFSLMAYTDNWGKNWKYSTPLVGLGNIQPAITVTKTGELVAYMRDNGPPPKRLQVSRSTDNGETWSLVKDTSIPNPGSAADIVTLKNSHWVLIYNDTEKRRNSLAVALSEDDGKTWPWKKKIEFDNSTNPREAHYPAIIQGHNGNIYVTYSYYLPEQKHVKRQTIKYAVFNESWIKSE